MLKKLFSLFKKTPDIEWYEHEKTSLTEQCPCCDYVTLPERGRYNICPVCFWEDDGLDIDELDFGSGANHGLSLREARANFAEFGACELIMVSKVLPESDRHKFEYQPRDI